MNGMKNILLQLVLAAVQDPATWEALERFVMNLLDRLRAWLVRYDAGAGAPA